jgi:prepilin-type processing-associated H-X9-DG protein
LRRLSTPLAMFYCPSRRKPMVYPWMNGGTQINCGTSTPSGAARNDYVGNVGSCLTFVGYHPTNTHPLPGEDSSWYGGGPPSITAFENPPGTMTPAAYASTANVAAVATGIMFYASMIRARDVTDGTSNTLLAGEKYLNPDSYATGADEGDNEDAMMGDNDDIMRYTCSNYHPELMYTRDPKQICTWGYWNTVAQDTPGWAGGSAGFGSAHANGAHMAYCDGRVDLLSYNTDFMVELFLSCRNDGQVIDANMSMNTAVSSSGGGGSSGGSGGSGGGSSGGTPTE